MPQGVYIRTEEHNKANSLSKLGLSHEGYKKYIRTEKHKEISRLNQKKAAAFNTGKKRPPMSKEWKENMSKAHTGVKLSEDHCKKIGDGHRGSKGWNWIPDRTQLKKSEGRKSSACNNWRNIVRSRDNFKCKIFNQDCIGVIETHHILDWINYPELRYDINNGVTLCHYHHPRGREEEKRLIPILQELVNK